MKRFYTDIDLAQVNATDSYGWTPLHWAAKDRSVERDSLKEILDAGADLESQEEEDGYTPLHIAVLNENLTATKELLTAGANVNAKDNTGSTPLGLACGRNRPLSVVEVLLKAGADIDAREDVFSQTPEQIAVICKNGPALNAIKIARSMERVKEQSREISK